MACRTIESVQITWPTGIVSIPVGTALPITGHFDLVGGGDDCVVTLGWKHTAPGVPVDFGTVVGAVAGTDYSKSFRPVVTGTHTIIMYAQNTDGLATSTAISVLVTAVPTKRDLHGQFVVYRDVGARREFQKLDGLGAWTDRQKEALKLGLESEAITLAKLVGGVPSRKALAFAMHEHGPAVSTPGGAVVLTQGTFYNFLDAGDETTVHDFNGYVCHPIVDYALLEASVPVTSLKLAYINCPLSPRFASAFYVNQRNALFAAVGEGGYFHLAGGIDEAHRVPFDDNNWFVRPSATAGHALAAYFLSAVNPYFDGCFSDETYGGIPEHYWTKYKESVDPVLTDADRPAYEILWDQMIVAFLADMKAGFGTGRALIANSAGATFAGIDGITIEQSHIVAEGEAAALAQFTTQKNFWQASANRFGSNVLNVAWNYELNIAGLVYRGTHNTGPPALSIIGNSMPGDWRPFSNASPWNTLLTSPSVHADSAAIMATVQAEASNIRFGNSFQPPMWVLENEHIARFFISSTNIYDTWDADEDDISDISIPISETMYQEPTADGHIIIYSKETNLLYEMSKYQWRDAPLLPTCTTFNVWDASGVGYASLPDPTKHWQTRGGRGSGVPIIGGLIRPEEIAAGEIRHALAFTFPKLRTDVPGVNMFQHPVACRSDAESASGFWPGASYPIEGMLFQLDPTVTDAEMDGWGLSAYGKVVARALQQYGAYVVDYGGSGVAFSVQLLGRTASEHRAAWDALFGSSFYTNVNNIPTSRLRVIDTGAATSFP